MAENILGLLLVTSSSRGRHVFRYPPDPASPDVRLAQPIYPSATFTATDADVDYKHPRAGGVGFRRKAFDDRSSNASIRRSLFGPSTKGSSNPLGKKGKKRSDDLRARYMNPSAEKAGSDCEDDSDHEEEDSSSEEDSDFEFLTKAGNVAYTNEGTGLPGRNHRQPSGDDDLKPQQSLRSMDHSTLLDISRRGSSSTTTATATGLDRAGDHIDKDAKRKAIESQYNYALGWPLEVLADMLTPPRSACNRRFELSVGNVVFLGHPVCAGPDGKWESPPEDDEPGDVLPSRGRRMREQANSLTNLDTVVEGNEAYTFAIAPNGDLNNKRGIAAKDFNQDDVPNLTMFHLVLIIDKPDPKPGTESHDEHHTQTLGLYDEIYREIAFKWTAAAYKLQCETNLVAKESWMIVKFKEKCLTEGISITECCRWTSSHCHLDRTLNYLYLRLHQLRSQPTNGLHSYLPTTITNRLADVTIQTILSPKPVNTDEAWAHWGEMEDMMSDSSEEDSDDDWDLPMMGSRRPELAVHPWQTLLLIDTDALASRDVENFGIVGLPADGIHLQSDTGRETPSKQVITRRGSRESRTTIDDNGEEDESVLLRRLIEACDVTKPLYEVAHLLRYDLEGVVIPLARDLVQNKRAILMDVVNIRLRTAVMPTTIDEHNASFDQYTARFAQSFPDLPPFPRLISAISLAPGPFIKVIPNPKPDLSTRQAYMAALLWLLKHDLVVQVHTRARVYAKKEVKVEAWKRLWYRRRRRWLEAVKERDLIRSPSGSDLVTPRASESYSNPLEVTFNPGTTPSSSTVPPPNSSAQYTNGNNGPTRKDFAYLDYDPALEMDSDEEFEGIDDKQKFSVEVEHPTKAEIPSFESTFIFKPARAQKDEARWLRVIRERADEVWASKFDLCVQYFDGVASFEEITYRTGLQRKELEKILQLYNGDVVKFIHP